jgi:hypothetical protein
MWPPFVRIWQTFTEGLAKKMKPKDWRNVQEKSVQIVDGNTADDVILTFTIGKKIMAAKYSPAEGIPCDWKKEMLS